MEVSPNALQEGQAKCAVKNNCVEPSMVEKTNSCKPSEIEVQSDIFPPSEDDALEVEHLFLDPQIEKDISEDILLMGAEHPKKRLPIDDCTFAVDYSNQKTDFGKFYCDAAMMQKHDVKYEFVDSLFQEVDQGAALHLESNFCSTSPDFLLDDGCPESFLVNCDSQTISCIRNFRSELQNKSMESNSDADEISDMSNVLNSANGTTSDRDAYMLDNARTNQLPDAFRRIVDGDNTSAEKEQSLEDYILCGFQNLKEINKFSNAIHCFSTSNDNEDEMIWIPNNLFEEVSSQFESIPDSSKVTGFSAENVACSDGNGQARNLCEAHKADNAHSNLEDDESAVITNKRLRKPTRRYIEETSDLKSRCCGETGGPVLQKPRNLRTSRSHPRKHAAVMSYIQGNEKVNKDEFSSSTEYKAIYASRFTNSQSRDNISDISEDSSGAIKNVKSGTRRKHHRLWTLPEVMKLIEGVSRYGVGRWTEIKRLLFPTSAFRSSVDLKDKWRNLLRTSAAQVHNRKQKKPRTPIPKTTATSSQPATPKVNVGSNKKHVSLPIPQYALRRIRELSMIHPYPRDRKSTAVPSSHYSF